VTRSGRAYAKAFLDVAPPGYDMEAFLAKAEVLRRAVAQDRLKTLFLAPAVPAEIKQSVLDELIALADLDELGRRFFRVVLANRRMGDVSGILAALRETHDHRQGVVEARVAVAAPVDEAGRARIAQALARRVGKTVRVSVEIDSAILGGFVARIGSEIFDASAARAIDRFAEEVKEKAKA
jgi:F-type H+-transporting ATPase subunit delta